VISIIIICYFQGLLRDRAITCELWYYPSVPRKTEWIHRLDATIEALAAFPSPTIDRSTVQKLLAVSPRQALRILNRLGAYTAGKSLLIDRAELLGKLHALQADPSVVFERRRRERVEVTLDQTRRDLAARRIRIPAQADVWSRQTSDLPAGIRLAPGKLEFSFQTTEELLGQLFELAQAVANDLERFRAIVEAPASGSRRQTLAGDQSTV
jgi:hypothetical protein